MVAKRFHLAYPCRLCVVFSNHCKEWKQPFCHSKKTYLFPISGAERLRQILRASWSEISEYRETAWSRSMVAQKCRVQTTSCHSRRQGNEKLLADTPCSVIWNFPMARHRGTALRSRVLPNRMFATFTHESAALLMHMSQQIAPFHGAVPWGTKATRVAAVSSK